VIKDITGKDFDSRDLADAPKSVELDMRWDIIEDAKKALKRYILDNGWSWGVTKVIISHA
jgi:hypothetical protein